MLTTRGPAACTKTILVGLVGGQFSGSVACALEGALTEAATVRIVRVSMQITSERARLGLPIEVVDILGDPAEVLAAESKSADLLVVESQIDEASALADPVLTRLRGATETLLVEVDRHGEVLRARAPGSSRPRQSVALSRLARNER